MMTWEELDLLKREVMMQVSSAPSPLQQIGFQQGLEAACRAIDRVARGEKKG
jgi:hypothetical protein